MSKFAVGQRVLLKEWKDLSDPNVDVVPEEVGEVLEMEGVDEDGVEWYLVRVDEAFRELEDDGLRGGVADDQMQAL